MENAEAATIMVQQLRALGVQLSIDDFVTGYSSLSYLHRFPSTTGRSIIFVSRIDPLRMTTPKSFAQLPRRTQPRYGIIAEGIETEDSISN